MQETGIGLTSSLKEINVNSCYDEGSLGDQRDTEGALKSLFDLIDEQL